MVRKKLVSVVSLLIVAVSSMIIGVFITEDAYAVDGDPQSIYATEDTTLVYGSSGNFLDEMDHYINTGEINSYLAKPHLIISYSAIQNIEITGVVNDGIYNTNVTPQFNIGTAYLNGNPFTSGTQVTAEGSYTLRVTAGSQ